jgi:hypothetical protein
MYFHRGMKNDSLGIWGAFFPKLVEPVGFSDCLLVLSCVFGILVFAMASFIPNVPQLSYFSPDGMNEMAGPADSVIIDLQRGFSRFKVSVLDNSPFFHKFAEQ